MGFFNSLKNWSDNNKRRKQEREARKQAVNQNPTEEQQKNNKKGKTNARKKIKKIGFMDMIKP